MSRLLCLLENVKCVWEPNELYILEAAIATMKWLNFGNRRTLVGLVVNA